MNTKKISALLLGIFILSACSPAPVQPTPDPNMIATAVYEQVFLPLTLTAGAVTPTPTVTPTPLATETPIPEPTSSEPLKRPVVTAFTGCWTGPGEQYTLISNIAEKKYVELLGMGNVPGWYVIRNPYFRNPCWIEAIYVRLDPRLDTSTFPVMTPAP